MKRLFLPLILCLGFFASQAQTATDFTATDCSGNSYNLFSDLDAGKIVVITWTMPCGACIAGSLTAYNIAQSYEATHPGKVKMLLVDDFGNTPCSAITSWGNSNGLTRSVKFSDASIRMNDYGVAGMPKTIAIAPDHSVIFNENNGVNPDNLQAAIDAVLSTTSVKDVAATISNMTVFPNPAGNAATLNLQLIKSSKVEISFYDLQGKRIQKAFSGNCNAGENQIPLDLSEINNGLYQLKIIAGNEVGTLQFLVAR